MVAPTDPFASRGDGAGGVSFGMRTRCVRALLAALVCVLVAPTTVIAAGPSFEHVHALAFDAGARTLWLGAHTGLYRSEDRGGTWVAVPLGAHGHGHAHDVMAIAAHPTDPAILYVGTHEAGVLKTTDGGKTWRAVNAGLAGLDAHGLALAPNAPDKLHVLIRDKGAGVYRSSNGGDAWVRVDDGPAGETKVLASVDIATGMGGIFLYAATADGLWRSPDCF